jgi:hypothetical protein
VAGGVDDIDGVSVPLAGNGRRLNGDAAFALLNHEVGGGVPVMDIAVLMDLAGVEQDSFRGGRFTGVDVGDYADVAYVRQTAHHIIAVF